METNTTRQNLLKGSILLFLASLIWGSAFVAQRLGMDYVGPFTFSAVRNLIGGVVLLPFIFLMDKRAKERQERKGLFWRKDRQLLRGGLVTGVLLCIAANFQQVGIKYTPVGKAGFITAMYIVLVPLLGIFLGRRAGLRIWLSVALAVAGLYLLSMAESLVPERGDVYVLCSALGFAFQILAIDYYAARVDGVKLACLEFFVCGLLSLAAALWAEQITLPGLRGAAWAILYAGVFSSGIAYTFQVLGQKELKPALASLIMSVESVVSALSGWLILHQQLSKREILGCVVMFAAIILAQLPEGRMGWKQS